MRETRIIKCNKQLTFSRFIFYRLKRSICTCNINIITWQFCWQEGVLFNSTCDIWLKLCGILKKKKKSLYIHVYTCHGIYISASVSWILSSIIFQFNEKIQQMKRKYSHKGVVSIEVPFDTYHDKSFSCAGKV